MNQQLFHSDTLPGRVPPAKWYWVCLSLAMMLAMGLAEYFETGSRGVPVQQLYTSKAAGYANLCLVAAAILYVVDFIAPSKGAGKWASGAATVGAIGSVLSLAVRWIETYFLHRPGHVPLNALYEAMAFFIAATVVTYLVMERVYRTRAAGVFVMLIVLCAVAYQAWMGATGLALLGPGVHAYG